MDCLAQDLRPRWLEGPPVLIAVVAPTMACAVASILRLYAFTPSMFIDVMAHVMWVTVVDDAFSS